MSDSGSEAPDPSAVASTAAATAASTMDSVVPALRAVVHNMSNSRTPDLPLHHGRPMTATQEGGSQSSPLSIAPATDWHAYTTSSSRAPAAPLPDNFDESTTGESTTMGAANTRTRRRKRSMAATTPNSAESSVGSGGQQQPRGKSRRKANETDARWSKRFTWPEELHRDFVAAIFDVGLKHSSPNSIMEHMPKHEQITSERIKSHLQKYRLHRLKSKKEFMESYDAGMTKLQQHTNNGGSASGSVAALGTLSAGKVASLLAHNTIQGHEVAPSEVAGPMSASRPVTVETEDFATGKSAGAADDAASAAASAGQEFFTLPQLSEAEKQSPIGASFGYLMGLFFSLKQQLIMQREAAAAEERERNDRIAAATDVYDSFVSAGSVAASHGVPQTPPSATVVSNPSTRNNLEENNMMKREMQHQMAYQTKMRGLKQQELSKFVDATTTEGNKDGEMTLLDSQHQDVSGVGAAGTADQQGAGETATGGQRRLHSTSLGNAEDLFHTDLMDEQLFEFLQFD